MIWGERRKAAAAPLPCIGNGFTSNGNGCGYSIDQIEQIVRAGAPAGENRSDVFHTIVGHYAGCTWPVERIYEHLQQFPTGSARSTSAKAGSRWRFPAAFANGPSCRRWPAMSSRSGPSEWMNGSEAAEAAGWAARTEMDPELQDDPELHEEPCRRGG